jgi:hypothetical protein
MRKAEKGGRRVGDGMEAYMISHLLINQDFAFSGSYFFTLPVGNDVCSILSGDVWHIFDKLDLKCQEILKETATPLQEEQMPTPLPLIIIPIPMEVIIIKMTMVRPITTAEPDTLNITPPLEAQRNRTAQGNK